MTRVCKLTVLILCAASLALAQNVSSSVRAAVLDSTGATVPDAECALTNQATTALLTVKSDSQGVCVFAIVPAGSYSFAVKAKGFKSLNVKDLAVDAGQTRTLGNLTLEVGALTESVQVTGEVSQINLATAEKSGTITMTQLQNVAVKGRDMFAYMTTIPGIVDNMSQGRETTSPDSLRGTFINGSRENAKNYAVDGITNLDTRVQQHLAVRTQHGHDRRSEGADQQLPGGVRPQRRRCDHGDHARRRQGLPRERIRHVPSREPECELVLEQSHERRQGTVPLPHHRLYRGRPSVHPGKFNTKRDKLFFFWNQEYTGQRKDYGTRLSTMPTADWNANGDFSKSVTGSGTKITINDPLTQTPVPGQHHPQEPIQHSGYGNVEFPADTELRRPD